MSHTIPCHKNLAQRGYMSWLIYGQYKHVSDREILRSFFVQHSGTQFYWHYIPLYGPKRLSKWLRFGKCNYIQVQYQEQKYQGVPLVPGLLRQYFLSSSLNGSPLGFPFRHHAESCNPPKGTEYIAVGQNSWNSPRHVGVNLLLLSVPTEDI